MRRMKRTVIFPVVVFLVLLLPMKGAIFLARIRCSGDIPVNGGIIGNRGVGIIDLDAVDRFVRETLRRSGTPGMTLAIVEGDQILYTAGYGRNADGSPIMSDTLWRSRR